MTTRTKPNRFDPVSLYDAKGGSAKKMVGDFRRDTLLSVANWLEHQNVTPEDTVTSFKAFTVKALRHVAEDES